MKGEMFDCGLFSVYENPKMCTTDMISSFTPRAYSFISFEIGLCEKICRNSI